MKKLLPSLLLSLLSFTALASGATPPPRLESWFVQFQSSQDREKFLTLSPPVKLEQLERKGERLLVLKIPAQEAKLFQGWALRQQGVSAVENNQQVKALQTPATR